MGFQNGLKSGGLEIGGLRNLTEISDIPDSVVDNFEDAPDGIYAKGDDLSTYYSIDTGSFTRNSGNIEGSILLEETAGNSDDKIISEYGSGLNAYPKPGDTIVFLTQHPGTSGDSGRPSVYCNSAINTDGQVEGYQMRVKPSDNHNGIDIIRIDGGTESVLNNTSVTLSVQTWYWVEVQTPSSTDNSIVLDLYNADVSANPPDRGTLIDSVSANDGTYDSQRGIGWEMDSSNVTGKAWDWLHIK